jgi:glycerol uptake facilitator-like aquaporin
VPSSRNAEVSLLAKLNQALQEFVYFVLILEVVLRARRTSRAHANPEQTACARVNERVLVSVVVPHVNGEVAVQQTAGPFEGVTLVYSFSRQQVDGFLSRDGTCTAKAANRLVYR